MEDSTVSSNIVSIGSRDVLNEILQKGAQQMLASAIENEVADYLEGHADQRDENGRRLVVRNGYLPAREIQTGIGQVAVRQPRVNTNGWMSKVNISVSPVRSSHPICGGPRASTS